MISSNPRVGTVAENYELSFRYTSSILDTCQLGAKECKTSFPRDAFSRCVLNGHGKQRAHMSTMAKRLRKPRMPKNQRCRRTSIMHR